MGLDGDVLSLDSDMLKLYPVYDRMVASRTLDGEAVIVHSRTRRMHVLDEVGTFIWEAMEDGDKTMGQVVESLCEEFDVKRDEAERDVRVFIEELHQERLVTLDKAPAP